MTQPVYVTTVPVWLTALIDDHRIPLRMLTDLNALSSILSLDDVSNYVLYASRLQPHTNGMYSDFINVIDTPKNTAWRLEHLELLKAHESELELIDSSTAHYDMDKSFYQPVGVDGNVLLLLGRKQPLYRTYADALSETMRELSLLVGYDQAIHSRLFEAYLNARKRNAV